MLLDSDVLLDSLYDLQVEYALLLEKYLHLEDSKKINYYEGCLAGVTSAIDTINVMIINDKRKVVKV